MSRILIASLVSAILLLTGNVGAQIGLDDEDQQQMMMSNLSAMRLAFTENRGQWDEKALFRAEAGGAVFFFCADEVVYIFTRDTDELIDDGMPDGPDGPGMPDKFDRPRYKKEAMLIKAQFIGTNPDPEIVGQDRLAHNCNYFYGNEPSKWRTDVPNYSAITYKDIYPGIDLKYHGNGQGMKYDFIVNPGADISQIRIRYDSVNNLAITSNGDLQADTRFGLIYENIPSIYQEIAGSKSDGSVGHDIKGQYRIIEPGVFGFQVEGYNPALQLVIDPELVYSTYLGGSDWDAGLGLAVDGSGQAYVIGYTYSSDFPTYNPYDGDFNSGVRDIFVSKLSSTGNSLLYSTYLGSIGYDEGFDIAVDGTGQAYITGFTNSSNFPTYNPYDGDNNGGFDVFVAKLSSGGNSLLYSTYLGGSGDDYGFGMAIGGSGQAYVTGQTSSSDFPTASSYDESFNGNLDVFVAELNSAGNSLLYSTYLGGSDVDYGIRLEVDGSGQAYVSGATSSFDFPAINPYDGSLDGYRDAFVAKINSAGNSLLYSTYLGGSDWDAGLGLAVDGSGQAYVTGHTSSLDFPMINPYDADPNGSYDVFVAKLGAAGNSLLYSTYLGGSVDDYGYAIAVDGSGHAYVTGWTRSSDFPTVNPYDGSFNGGYDVFVAEFSLAGNSLLYSSYLGGSSDDGSLYEHGDIAVDGSGQAYVTGLTSSSDFPMVNPYDESVNGGYDVFVAKFGPEAEQVPTLSEWGMLIMGLFLLAIGTVAVVKGRRGIIANSYR